LEGAEYIFRRINLVHEIMFESLKINRRGVRQLGDYKVAIFK
jgi:hypothetical protein